MATPAAKVLEQALELTPEERVRLAAELLASVDPQVEPAEWAAAWKDELARRKEERTVPAAEVSAQLLARFQAR